MTFSIVARCPQTNAFGMALCSSSTAVGARCTHLRHGVGGAASQNVTDPRLGEYALDLMNEGHSALDVIEILADSEPTIEYRQISVVDKEGASAVFSGRHVLGTFGERIERDVAVAGNLLANEFVVAAIIERFLDSNGDNLADKLLDALSAGLKAGGEAGPVHSAALMVTSEAGWPETDLRADYSVDPIADLKHLWSVWAPERHDYITRGINPRIAPPYGVPGEM